MVFQAAAHKVLGEFNIVTEYQGAIDDAVKNAEGKSEEFVKKWIERRLGNYLEERESLSGFRDALTDMASDEKKPVVVFIDELDRCRPDFAVRLIERIKHFFETPNVVFVLLIHREQLNRAIAGVYGPSTDGAAYLSKFVHFFFTLPAADNKHYIEIVLGCLGVADDGRSDRFVGCFAGWRNLADLSMRDIERGCALFAYATLQGGEDLLAYLIVLKLRKPGVFQRILNDDRTAYGEAKRWMIDLAAASSEFKVAEISSFRRYINNLIQIHSDIESGEDARNAGNTMGMIRELGSNVQGKSSIKTFLRYTREIDLPIA